MAQDLLTKFYTCINLRLEDKLAELSKIIDQSSPNKELQVLFPQLINNIFASSFSNGWNLKTITFENNRHAFEALINFLEPQGPMLRLCYKLLSDPQLKYDLPINVLPLDLQMSLERGRCPQFYTDMLVMESQALNVVALALNPFDYYIFNFALHLINSGQHQSTWENWNSVYFALSCDYLMHFLPSDPNVAVQPQIPNYTGKVPMAAPLQTANRPLCSPTLLLLPDLCGMNNQHAPQTQARNEVWRSETVLQVFIDIWMSVEQFSAMDVEMYQRNYTAMCSSPERVRTVRVLIKHIHSFSANHLSDPASRSSSLRKYARQIVCARAYHYVKYLVMTWPLDASFRLVMELWLSLIQPWRYTDNTINQDRFPGQNNNQEEGNPGTLDASHATQFIAENFPAYTCIFQLILPRFMRLDLTAYKNAVMLFRLGKVFSQQHLVPILWNLEQAITDNASSYHHSPDMSYNSTHEQSYTYNGVALHKWVAIAKQAITELNLSTNFEYDPIWSDNKTPFVLEFVKKIYSAKLAAENIVQKFSKKLSEQHRGLWSSVKHWLMIGNNFEDEILLDECKKVPIYLNTSIQYFSNIFGFNESALLPPPEPVGDASILDHSSFSNGTDFPASVTNKLRNKPTEVHYMGDPDLMPITSFESTILVRMFYQITTKLNDVYREEFTNIWSNNNFGGYIAREILQKPCTIRTYVKDATNHQNIASQELPARLSLRRLGSYAFVFWLTMGYVIFKMFAINGFLYIFVLFTVWMFIIFTKSSLKFLRIIS